MEKYVDGAVYLKKNIPDKLLRFFREKNEKFVIADIVGIVVLKKIIYVFLPKNTDESKINLNHLNILLNTLKKSTNLLTGVGNDNFELEKSDLTKTIEWLINDFNNNGVYKVVEKDLYSGEGGKIQWDKTLKKEVPLYANENLIFMDFVRKKKKISDSVITQIHKHVLNNLSQNYGKFFNFNFSEVLNFRLSLTEINNILMKQLKVARNERKKNLILNLYNYLNLTSSENSEFYYVTRDFHVIFESALKSVMNHKKELKKYVPKAKWNLRIRNVEYSSKNTQIPDVLVVRKEFIDIYDAKYYSLIDFVERKGNKTTPLDWYSVGNQFLYDFTFPYEKIGYNPGTNNFVFPGYPITNFIKDIGDVSLSINGLSKKINVKLIDTFDLLNKAFLSV